MSTKDLSDEEMLQLLDLLDRFEAQYPDEDHDFYAIMRQARKRKLIRD